MIYVSPGHYPAKRGASHLGFSEYPETSLWASYLNFLLIERGLESTCVPAESLIEKVNFINRKPGSAELAIEIHFNADVNMEGVGHETLYCPGSNKGELLATHVNDKISRAMRPNRGVKKGWYQLNDKNEINHFLEKTVCPAIIVEPEFIYKKEYIQSSRAKVCHLIVDGVINYLTEIKRI